MSRFFSFALILSLLFFPAFRSRAQLLTTHAAEAQQESQETSQGRTSQGADVVPWIAAKVQHAYGLPETRPKAKGTLAVDGTGIAFTSSASHYRMEWKEITAISHGSERVEMWGTTGRLVRMAIPNGGGLAAAGVMHHKVNQLTIEFRDARGAYHAAVFVLDGRDAARVAETYRQLPAPPAALQADDVAESVPQPVGCESKVGVRSVYLPAPSWEQANVPAAYRAMVYEHLVDRLRRSDINLRVKRDGEATAGCAQPAIRLAIVSFKPGNQVQRSMTGPIGFFAGTTQMVFRVEVSDASGAVLASEQIKATVRGDGESRGVTEAVAKKIAKAYVKSLQHPATVQLAKESTPRGATQAFAASHE